MELRFDYLKSRSELRSYVSYQRVPPECITSPVASHTTSISPLYRFNSCAPNHKHFRVDAEHLPEQQFTLFVQARPFALQLHLPLTHTREQQLAFATHPIVLARQVVFFHRNASNMSTIQSTWPAVKYPYCIKHCVYP
jgi:hypothetical protein